VLNAAANDDKRDMIMAGFTHQLTPAAEPGRPVLARAADAHSAALANTKSKGDYFAFVADYAFSSAPTPTWKSTTPSTGCGRLLQRRQQARRLHGGCASPLLMHLAG
jgi:hypothetical protein